jgi:protein tyrosine phosphatase (PTP) superfamily phosphohydrolase (DUF442 family)
MSDAVSAGPPRSEASPRRRPRSHRLFLLILALVAVGVGLGRNILNNYRVVLPGRVFRSGQLSRADLEARITQCGLRAVLNLRGANPDEEWYQEECDVAGQSGVRHYDLPTDSQYPPSAAELREIIAVLDACERPLLIHCESGIDRSGLAAAVAVLLGDGGSLEMARQQLGVGLLRLLDRPSTDRQRAFVGLYESWLARQGQRHSVGQFREWALHIYSRPAELAEDGAPDHSAN